MTATMLAPPETDLAGSPSNRRRLMLIAYNFPPVGGAGVQRPVKWVKYLRRFGWDVTVVMPSNPSVPVLDESLLQEIPAETRIIRAKTLEPGYDVKQKVAGVSRKPGGIAGRIKSALKAVVKGCLQPDPQVLWYPHAVAAATQELRRTPHDAILCTAPPYSSFLIGRTLKRRFGLPLILDYRDEWDLSSQYLEQAHRDPVSHWIQERQQQAVLQAADAVIATTQSSIDRLETRLQRLNHKPQRLCIYNGYDEDDFDSHAPAKKCSAHARFRLVYTGTLWNLTDVSPLVQALEQLNRESPALAGRLELVCVGRKTPEQQEVLHRLETTHIELTDLAYCPHSAALDLLKSADALCLLLSDVPGADRVVPAKLFEYLAMHKDLLAIAPAGEATCIASRFHEQSCFPPADVNGICHWLRSRVAEGPRTVTFDPAAILEFSREEQTRRLADLLNRLGRNPHARNAVAADSAVAATTVGEVHP